MALSPEEQQQLEALTAKAKEPDPEQDFEIEIGDGGKYARLPYSRGKSWLQQFGIDLDPPANDDGDGDGDGKPEPKKTRKPAGAKEPADDPGYWSKRRQTG